MGCQSIAGLPPALNSPVPILYTWVERGTVRVKCLAQEHNTISPARARTRTARSGDERTNHAPHLPSDFPEIYHKNLCHPLSLSFTDQLCLQGKSTKPASYDNKEHFISVNKQLGLLRNEALFQGSTFSYTDKKSTISLF